MRPDTPTADDSLRVITPWMLFLVATGFGLSSTFQAYWLDRVEQHPMPSWPVLRLLALNLCYWYVPALLAPIVMRLALRFRPDRTRWTTVLLFHTGAVLVYSCVHTAVMTPIGRLLIPPADGLTRTTTFWRAAAYQYLMQLDWMLMTYLFLVGVASALAYRRESESRALSASRLETRVVEAQLRALQCELRPHFLFNTLNTISGLMRTDMRAADATLDSLADLLRMTLNTADTHPLHEELSIARKYLDIEQTRYGDRLTVAMHVTPDALDALVPSLLLQPLVENAVRHGIGPYARPGRVAVRASRSGGRLTMQVCDSGNGAPPDRLTALNGGIGLTNTRARLAHLYSEAHVLEFSNVSDGFCVSVSIPYRTADGLVERQTGAA